MYVLDRNRDVGFFCRHAREGTHRDENEVAALHRSPRVIASISVA